MLVDEYEYAVVVDDEYADVVAVAVDDEYAYVINADVGRSIVKPVQNEKMC